MARLTELTTTWLAGMDKVIEERRQNEKNAQQTLLTGVAKAQMDAIRTLIGEMKRHEQDLLALSASDPVVLMKRPFGTAS